ncbi:TrmH family RNA methyltransferase [bacterium]|nr:TrmH family RNA methyltransferase [bacterium]
MRGYFGIGAEGISKPMNLGALLRTAHAFGASFTFSVAAPRAMQEAYLADTSKSASHVPYYPWASISDMALPQGCQLVGIELTEDAVDLPSFKHPPAAAYVLGREKGDLSAEMLSRCAHVVRIPTRFCINLSLAGALVMYDRVVSLGGYPPRPIMPGGPDEGVRRRRPKP